MKKIKIKRVDNPKRLKTISFYQLKAIKKSYTFKSMKI